MTISPLPYTTVQALSSSQVLVDSISLVKELVENALDARASSISVEVSTNSLDVIQVKDDCFGIGPEDRELLAQRHCTSKIRNLDDLSKIGGKFLGFRGVALASATEMSGSVVISTRIEGELVGEVLRFDREGKLVSRVHKSLPSGATVRIEDFLKFIPVRRQASLKNPSKSLQRIKSLLQAYLLARPMVRFSLSVLGDEKNKVNWAYGSKSGATIMDAAIQTFGASLASNCVLKYWTPLLGFVQDVSLLYESVTDLGIIAVLPKQSCDATAISNVGQYLSVDSRPVSCKRGALKKIVEVFKSYVQHATEDKQKPNNPFLCLNLNCPFGSYDANIEPAKDDVLFNDEEKLLETCKDFFGTMYGDSKEDGGCDIAREREAEPASDLLLKTRNDSATSRERAPEISRDPKLGAEKAVNSNSYIANVENQDVLQMPSISYPSTPLYSSPSVKGTPKLSLDGENKTSTDWWSSMYPVVEEGLEIFDSVGSEEGLTEEEDSGGRGGETSNPWVIAKMNAPIRRRKTSNNDLNTADFNGQLLTPRKLGVEAMSSPVKIGSGRPPLGTRKVNQLPSPQKDFSSSPQTLISISPQKNPLYQGTLGMRRNQNSQPRVARPLGLQPKEQQAPIQNHTVDHSNKTLDSWMRKTTQNSPAENLQQSSPNSLSLQDIPNISQRPRQRRPNNNISQTQPLQKPFVPPRPKKNTQQTSSDSSNGISRSVPPRRPPLQEYKSRQNHGRALKEVIGNIDQSHRPAPRFSYSSSMSRSGTLQTDPSSLQSNLWLNQETSTFENTAAHFPSETLSNQYDPFSRSVSLSPSPEPPILVKIPTTRVPTSVTTIRASSGKLARYDIYVGKGGISQGLSDPDSAGIITSWEKRTRVLLAARGGNWMLEGSIDLKKALEKHVCRG